MKFKDLPKEIQILAELRAMQGNFKIPEDSLIGDDTQWTRTPEGWGFWYNIDLGNFLPYYELYKDKTLQSETQTEWQPTKGEMVEVSDNGISWKEREFIVFAEKAEMNKYITYSGDKTLINSWTYCRKLQNEFTIDEARKIISELKGIELEKIIIK